MLMQAILDSAIKGALAAQNKLNLDDGLDEHGTFSRAEFPRLNACREINELAKSD